MSKETVEPVGSLFGDFIEAYETAQAREGVADLAAFLPDTDHPLYDAVLRELVRVDLEYGWKRGRPQPLDEYLRRFPQLAQDVRALEEIAFEEYRLRVQAGEQPNREEYVHRFGLTHIQLPRDAVSSDGQRSVLQPQDEESGPGPSAVRLLEDVAREYQQLFEKAGSESPDLESWCTALGNDSGPAGLFRQLHQTDPRSAQRLADALTSFPEIGSNFLDFNLLVELGRGAFGRVYLARQGELADRLVALKISTDLFGEPQTLAQLQHTNIVPIYSIHRSGPYQAVCMPYLGATTLADICRELEQRGGVPDSGKALVSTLHDRVQKTTARMTGGERESAGSPVASSGTRHSAPAPRLQAILEMLASQSYVRSILWLAVRLADGLAHAHERGILHHDLKPANVLLTDEGQPMLLDFNIAEDTKSPVRAATRLVGGTLPYMAPEQLAAVNGADVVVDQRSDIYSLGLILYELLAGRQPFPRPRGPLHKLPAMLLADRQRLPPRPRHHNPLLSPAVESILLHCLQPDPARRYQTASQLREDLQRQLDDLPLRYAPEPSLRERAGKWVRRHPRLTSASTVCLLAGTVLAIVTGTFGYWWLDRTRRDEARRTYDHFTQQLHTARHLLNTESRDIAKWAEGKEAVQACLASYPVLADVGWQERPVVRYLDADRRNRLPEDVGEVLFLAARAALRDARDQAAADDGSLLAALDFNRRAEALYEARGVPPPLWQQRSEIEHLLGRASDAQEAAARAQNGMLRTARDHYLAASELALRGRYREAIPLLEEARRQDPRDFWYCFLLGHCHAQRTHLTEAWACFSICIALRPDEWRGHFNRGLVQLRQRHFAKAQEDFTRVLNLKPNSPEAAFNRAQARRGLRQFREALTDLELAEDLGFCPTRVAFLRASIRELLGDKNGAKRDRAAALRLEPTDEHGWIARANARVMDHDLAGAEADLKQALIRNPRSYGAWLSLSHALADEPGRTEEAVRALDRALAIEPDFAEARSGRAVLLARLGRREAALADAREAVALSDQPHILYQVAGVYALTSQQEPGDRTLAYAYLSRALRAGFGWDLLKDDPELNPIRKDREFKEVVQAARKLLAIAQ